MSRFAVVTLAMVTVYAGAMPARAARYKFLGNRPCQECHKEIYASWEKSLHANVFELLKPGEREKEKKEVGLDPTTDFREDSSCMRCHVTAWDEGGYSMENRSDDWKGIGCEECHGSAERWLALHEKKDLRKRDRRLKQAGLIKPFKGKTVCLRCHGNINSPYKYRDQGRDRDWTDPKFAETYHLLK